MECNVNSTRGYLKQGHKTLANSKLRLIFALHLSLLISNGLIRNKDIMCISYPHDIEMLVLIQIFLEAFDLSFTNISSPCILLTVVKSKYT